VKPEKVWRVEHRDTWLGPWWHPYANTKWCPVQLYNAARKQGDIADSGPDPQSDVPHCPRFTCDWFCGTRHLDQLLDWFPCPKGRRAMAQCGMIIRQLEVPARFIRDGRHQSVFKRGVSKVIKELDLVTLRNLNLGRGNGEYD
jgi:hypothetical protein